MWASTAPAAIAGLIDLLAGAQALDGVTVLDGPEVTAATFTECVVVGWGGTDDGTGVEGQFVDAGLARAPSREQYTIRCAAIVGAGDTEQVAASRTRAYELLSAVGGALAADPTLGGPAMSAVLSDATLTQTQASNGVTALLAFGIAVDAFTQR